MFFYAMSWRGLTTILAASFQDKPIGQIAHLLDLELKQLPEPAAADVSIEKSDAAFKRKAEIYINAWLSDIFNDKSANEQLFAIMKKATAEAKANGLTPEQLDELLKDEA